MEDTLRSQTILTENRGIAAQAVLEFSLKPRTSAFIEDEGPPMLDGGTSFIKIRILAQENPSLVFTSLAHRIDFSLLRESFRLIHKGESTGVDGVTAEEYAKNLDQNLYNLFLRLKRGQYVATPVRRIWIPKENGKMRPIGIPALEDKIVQKAVETILSVIYNVDFYNFSHGFRKGHSQHMAIAELRDQCWNKNINWIVEADISGFFDNINHELLKDIIRQRVNDGGILRLIGKWLKAGVMEEGKLMETEKGTPQGGVISPLLANIFLHTVLDEWFVKEIKPQVRRGCFIVRYADDFVIGFELKPDAERMMRELPKRFAMFGLSLNMEKTKLVPFMKPMGKRLSSTSILGTFDFLGFTFYWGKSLSGKWVIKKQTARKRHKRFMQRLWEWFRKERHKPMNKQYKELCAKLRGWYQYFGVRHNYQALIIVYEFAKRAWRYWLNRRTNKGKMSWEKFKELLERTYPLPKPRIMHSI